MLLYEPKDIKDKIRPLDPSKTFFTMAVTFYPEHLPGGIRSLKKAIKAISKNVYQIIGIYHNKSAEKPHFHVIVRTIGKNRQNVGTMLTKLGIVFRAEDASFLRRRGLETCGSFTDYAVYLLHQTTAARQEGKESYDPSDLISNLSRLELDHILEGYTPSKLAITRKSMPYLIDKMKMAGYEHKPFDFVLNSYNILGLTKSQEKILQEAYINGVKRRLSKDDFFPRLVLEIVYPDGMNNDQVRQINDAIKHALSDYRFIQSSKWQPIYNLDPLTDALIITDLDYNALNDWRYQRLATKKTLELAMDEIIKKKCIWAGRIFVAARYNSIELGNSLEEERAKSPKSFAHNHKDYDPSTFDSIEKKANILFNSILCAVKDNKLVAESMNFSSSTPEAVEFYKSTFKEFRTRFNECMFKKHETMSISIDDLNAD